MSDLSKIPALVDEQTFHVVVESPRGAGVKLKYDEQLHAMSVSRPLPLGLVYPYDWGFIPSTRGGDGDPIDTLVLWDVSTFPGVVLCCRAIGIIRVEQNRSPERSQERIRNDRVLALPVESRRERELISGKPIPDRVRDEIANFLIAATTLEGKEATILRWDGPADALAYIAASA
jgi:inorganic pyrophosphatase